MTRIVQDSKKETPLGLARCNRCRIADHQKEAADKDMVASIRKSMYGFSPKKPGVDIYIHPKNVEIPANYKTAHEMGNFMAFELIGEGEEPSQYWVAWYPAVPNKCECRMM